MAKKPGRPKKMPEERADITLRFRVRPAEEQEIREAAKKSGHLGLSGWIREKLLDAARKGSEG